MSELEHNGAVVPAEQRPIEVITEEILFYKRQAGGAIIEIGRRLIEAKERLSHGEWLPWLSEKVDVSERSAQNFMRLAREYEKSAEIADLGASKALALLALPVSEREGFAAEKHLINGEEKSVADMTAAELKQAIKERDEAVKRAETAETMGAELNRAANEADSRAAALREALEDQKKQAEEELRAAAREKAELEQQLEELRNAPRQVAVETVVDQEAVKNAADAARQEAEEELKGRLGKAEQAKETAEQAKARAEQELAALKAEQAKAAAVADRERRGLEEQVQVLQKKLAVASSSEMTVFKLHFDQGQESIRKMTGCIERMEEAGDAEGAGKLKKAMRALLEAALGGL